MSFYVAGLDLGQAQDYSALGILEVTGTPVSLEYEDLEPELGLPRSRRASVEAPPARVALRHLERFELQTRYPAIVDQVITRLSQVPGVVWLAVDRTGVGAAVYDLFRGRIAHLVGITITGGVEVSGERGELRVPKRDLVHGLLVALQQGRFEASSQLALAPVLMRELTNFRLKVNLQTAHDSYEAWREGDHDDLVLAVAIAAWAAEQVVAARYREQYARVAAAAEELEWVLWERQVRISPY
jgi:hypothetical protein